MDYWLWILGFIVCIALCTWLQLKSETCGWCSPQVEQVFQNGIWTTYPRITRDQWRREGRSFSGLGTEVGIVEDRLYSRLLTESCITASGHMAWYVRMLLFLTGVDAWPMERIPPLFTGVTFWSLILLPMTLLSCQLRTEGDNLSSQELVRGCWQNHIYKPYHTLLKRNSIVCLVHSAGAYTWVWRNCIWMFQHWLWTPTYLSVERGFAKDCQAVILALTLDLYSAYGPFLGRFACFQLYTLFSYFFFTYLFEWLFPFLFSAYHIVYI